MKMLPATGNNPMTGSIIKLTSGNFIAHILDM